MSGILKAGAKLAGTLGSAIKQTATNPLPMKTVAKAVGVAAGAGIGGGLYAGKKANEVRTVGNPNPPFLGAKTISKIFGKS